MSDECANVTQVAVLGHRVGQLEEVTKSIDASLKTLVRLEEKHLQTSASLERAFGEIKDSKERIGVIEAEMPTLKLVRGWVITGAIGIMALVGVQVYSLISHPISNQHDVSRADK